MKEIKRILKKGIQDDGCYTSQEFKSFARKFKNRFGKEVAKVGGINLQQNVGHYFISGFFTVGEQPYYYSLSDVRYFPDDKLLIRTAKDYRDFTGGTNHFLPLEENMLVGKIQYIR